MARSTWSFLIGLLSSFMYTCLTLFYIVYVLYLCGYIELHETEEDSDESKENFESFRVSMNIYIIVLETVAFVAMIVVSILLQIGVKRESPQLLSPWLWLSGVAIAFAALGLALSQSYWDVEFSLDLLVILLQSAMWYPIFVHYKEMRKKERLHTEHCDRQQNGAAYYIGRSPDSVYVPTTEFVNTSWSETLP